MKSLVTISVVCVLLLSPLSRMYIFLSFLANQEEIAKNICVQKEVENNCCQGYCQLTAEMSENDSQESEKSVPFLLKLKIDALFCVDMPDWTLSSYAESIPSLCYGTSRDQWVHSHVIHRIFHPPIPQIAG
jgi:hypothetical protein